MDLDLNHFSRSEFTRGGVDWFDQMSAALLRKADALREDHGQAIHISPHPRALGRPGSGSTDHDPDRNGGIVCAMDVFPDGIETPDQMAEFVRKAEARGLTALGVYPHWQDGAGNTRAGVHLGWRPDRVGNPARWGMVRKEPLGPQHVVGIDQAIERVGSEPK